jgi:hypothetical protein
MSAPADPNSLLDPAAHRRLGINLFNHVWTFLDMPQRSEDDTFEMIHAAHASLWHWSRPGVGEPVNIVRGEWQISRACSVAGRAEPAMVHARRCLALCETHGIADFDLAFAHEAIARAAHIARDTATRDAHLQRARACADDIADPEDRQHLLAQLETIVGN